MEMFAIPTMNVSTAGQVADLRVDLLAVAQTTGNGSGGVQLMYTVEDPIQV